MRTLLTRQQWLGAVLLFLIVTASATFVHIYTSRNRVEPNEQLFPFDPNTADSLTLNALGLEPWRVKAILKYRAKGGVYRKVEDFNFQMDSTTWRRYRPFVRIDAIAVRRQDSLRESAFRAHWDSIHQARLDSFARINQLRRDSFQRVNQHRRDSFQQLREARKDSLQRAHEAYLDSLYPHRHKVDTILEINTADTISLQMIRGIGPAMARWIISYRDQLGGYYSVEQIREIKQIRVRQINVDSVLLHLSVNPLSVNKIDVQRANLNTLRKHPYLQPFEKAKAIYEWRQRHTRKMRPEDLQKIEELTDEDRQKLLHYLDF